MAIDRTTRGMAGSALGRANETPTNNETERLLWEALRQMPATTAPTVPTTVPTASVGTRYYIDPNHASASDSNAGTSPALPWANLTKLNGLGPGVGAIIYIAADATFDIADTRSTYSARTKFPYNSADAIRGSSVSPIVIRPYYPRGTSAQQKPILRWYGYVPSGDWTNETGIGANIWSCAWTNSSFNNDSDLYLAFGATIDAAELGIAARQKVDGQTYGNTPQQLAEARDYAVSDADNKIYVYSPSNPTTYYGGVYICGLPILATSWQGLHHTKITGLRFEYCSAISCEHASTTQNAVQGIEVAGCEFYRAVVGYFKSGGTNASPSEMTLSIHDNVFYETPFSGIRLGGVGGTAGNTLSWEVYRNRVYSGNMCSSLGGALLYTQTVGGTKAIAWGNYGYDCRNGTGGNNIDGSFIYCDVGTNKALITANMAERCGAPFHLNNSIGVLFVANAGVDCLCLAQVTGAPDVSVANQSYILAHNTWLWTGRIAAASLQVGPGGPTASSSVVVQYNDNYATFGNKFANFVFANNLAVALGSDVSGKKMVQYISGQITTTLVVGNAALGLGPTLSSDNGSDTTTTAGFFAAVGAVSDVGDWLQNAASGQVRTTKDGVLTGIGQALSQQYQDVAGKNYATRPTPGCYEPLAT